MVFGTRKRRPYICICMPFYLLYSIVFFFQLIIMFFLVVTSVRNTHYTMIVSCAGQKDETHTSIGQQVGKHFFDRVGYIAVAVADRRKIGHSAWHAAKQNQIKCECDCSQKKCVSSYIALLWLALHI